MRWVQYSSEDKIFLGNVSEDDLNAVLSQTHFEVALDMGPRVRKKR